MCSSDLLRGSLEHQIELNKRNVRVVQEIHEVGADEDLHVPNSKLVLDAENFFVECFCDTIKRE